MLRAVRVTVKRVGPVRTREKACGPFGLCSVWRAESVQRGLRLE